MKISLRILFFSFGLPVAMNAMENQELSDAIESADEVDEIQDNRVSQKYARSFEQEESVLDSLSDELGEK